MRGMGKILVVLAMLVAGCSTSPSASHGKVALNPAYLSETVNIGSTVRSTVLRVSNNSFIGYAIRTSGTASGTWAVQYSNDYVAGTDSPSSDAKWDTYTLSSTPPAASGSPQTFGIVLDNYEYAFVRWIFTNTGGAGSALSVAQIK